MDMNTDIIHLRVFQVLFIWRFFRTQNVDDVFYLQIGVCGHTSSSSECGIISDLIAQCHVKWQGYLKHNFAEISEGMKIAYFFLPP